MDALIEACQQSSARSRWALLAAVSALAGWAQAPQTVPVGHGLRLLPAGGSYTEVQTRTPIFEFNGSWSGIPYDEGIIRAGGCFERIPEGIDYSKGKLSLLALPDRTLKPGTGSMAVLLINDTESAQTLYTGDSSIQGGVKVHQEAWVRTGRWALLEYYPSKGMGFCGNGATSITIPPHTGLAFSARRYRGSSEARMRVVIRKDQGSFQEDLVSNEFQGRIDPGQFSMGYDYAHFVLGKVDQYPMPPEDGYTLPKLLEAPKVQGGISGTWKEWGLPPFNSRPRSIEVGEDPAPTQDRSINVHVTVDERGRVLEAHAEDPALMWTEEMPRSCGWAVATAISRGRFLPATVDGHPVASTGAFDTSNLPRQCILAFRPAAFLGPHPGFRGFRGFQDESRPYWHVVITHMGVVAQATPVGANHPVDEKRLSESSARLKSLRFAPATINGNTVFFECLLVEDVAK